MDTMNKIYANFMGVKDPVEIKRYDAYVSNRYDLDEYIGFEYGTMHYEDYEDIEIHENEYKYWDYQFLGALKDEKLFRKDLTKDEMYTMISRAYLAGFITDPYEMEQEINTWEDEEE